MKGAISGAVIGVLLVAVLLGGLAIGWGVTQLAVPAVVAIEYDGEFGTDGAIATEGPWGSSFTEGTDCNVTSNILGDSSYRGCIYETKTTIAGVYQNFTRFIFPFQFEIDTGPVQGGDIDMDMQNTGTGQFQDDAYIDVVQIWTHDNEPRIVYDLEKYIEDAGASVDAIFSVLQADEYVLLTEFLTNDINPVAVDGDDICKIKIDLTTDGDADVAYVLAENG